jgi:hypothetical protein
MMSTASHYFIGLDLGQAQDFTAVAIIERPYGPEVRHHVRYLRRFPLGTPYPEIVEQVVKLAGHPALCNPDLVVDQTGVGRAVVDLFREAYLIGDLVPVLITGGHTVSYGGSSSWHVPKKELVSGLQVLLQAQRLRIAKGLPEADTLAQELRNFKVKITVAGNETFESWRERDHDDLVLAVALAAWWAERTAPLMHLAEPMSFGRGHHRW